MHSRILTFGALGLALLAASCGRPSTKVCSADGECPRGSYCNEGACFERGSPVLKTTSLTDAVFGLDYSAPLVAEGGTTPLRWTLVSAPPELGWVSVDVTGAVTGSPTQPVSPGASIRVRVEDDLGLSAEGTVQLGVRICSEGEEGCPIVSPPFLLGQTLPVAVRNEAYEHVVTVQGGKRPLTFSLPSPPLNLPWLTIEAATGRLSGVPTELINPVQTFTVRVQEPDDPADPNDGRQRDTTFAIGVRNCLDGETQACAISSGGACEVGTKVCTNDAFGTCLDRAKSTELARCGGSCLPCGRSGDACADGLCRCGAGPECPAPTGGFGTGVCTSGVCSKECNADRHLCPDDRCHLNSDVNHCGPSCVTCPTLPRPNTTKILCAYARCVPKCAEGFWDCDLNAATGCEVAAAKRPTGCKSCVNCGEGVCCNGEVCLTKGGTSFCMKSIGIGDIGVVQPNP